MAVHTIPLSEREAEALDNLEVALNRAMDRADRNAVGGLSIRGDEAKQLEAAIAAWNEVSEEEHG